MPFKANATCRHHIPRQRQRVTNWSEYDAVLRQRWRNPFGPGYQGHETGIVHD
jgi:hypothetical protein